MPVDKDGIKHNLITARFLYESKHVNYTHFTPFQN